MKKYILLLLVHFIVLGGVLAQDSTLVAGNDSLMQDSVVVSSPNDAIQSANDHYMKEDYHSAIKLYEQALLNGSSASAYYNLGNAYYKINEIAPAILNYERALLLDPGDDDIRFNLEMAKLKTVDKIDPLGEFFLAKWMNSLRNIYSTNQWAWVGIVTFLLFIGCLTLFFFTRKIQWKKIGFYAGIFFLLITIGSNIFSYQQKRNLTSKNAAIIFIPTVTIKSSPDKSGTDIVVLHEGTKVYIKSQLGSWNEVVLENGTVGWIESQMIEII